MFQLLFGTLGYPILWRGWSDFFIGEHVRKFKSMEFGPCMSRTVWEYAQAGVPQANLTGSMKSLILNFAQKTIFGPQRPSSPAPENILDTLYIFGLSWANRLAEKANSKRKWLGLHNLACSNSEQIYQLKRSSEALFWLAAQKLSYSCLSWLNLSSSPPAGPNPSSHDGWRNRGVPADDGDGGHG
ncbi:hypothetical protein C8J57DRAFT_1481979 [Mycena rebaudengoi]|nr:hypothetical protein C8J57DRAFT_1481979 [Mycena rebaudengoi]